MSCKYDIIVEGGRKRVRALRHFTVQGRDVCPMELGGYVYDDKTLSQDGNCWIFSGSLEYPGVRVMDEAIVDMGINLPKDIARPKATIISGNSRIMGAISFETQSFDVAQTPTRFEQGGFNVTVGSIPIKSNATTRVRIPAQLFAGTVGKVAITSTAYEARLISLDEAGIITSATAWTVGGPAVTLTSTAPYILVDLRKVGVTAISPADVTAAGITITLARGATVRIFNSSIVPVYNGAVTGATDILRLSVSGTSSAATSVNFQNSYFRAECTINVNNAFAVNGDFIKVNYNMVLTAGVTNYISGIFRNTNINNPASVNVAVTSKGFFDVSDCPDFEFSLITFPDLAAMIASGKTFYFKNCNMPVGSAIHYYDPKVNVWDNIDFTKAMADLWKALPLAGTVRLVSSNKQGWYRLYDVTPKAHGALVESISSLAAGSFSRYADTYDSVLHKDCTIAGVFTITGRNVFGGTLGGASKITNTTETAMVIDGNFRIEGNASVTDTPLKGTGYFGDNAEMKNGVVEGYIYMAENAKYIPAVVANPAVIRMLKMSGNSKVLKQRDSAAASVVDLAMSDNSVIDAVVSFVGKMILRDNARIVRTDTTSAVTVYGSLEMKDNARIEGTSSVVSRGEISLVGNFSASGTRNIIGKQTISNISQIGETELPPMKTNW